MSKFYTKCGNSLEEGVKFCTRCGQAVRDISAPLSAKKAGEDPPRIIKEKSQVIKNLVLFGMFLVAILIASIVGGKVVMF